MEYLQYEIVRFRKTREEISFKPYYKWNTFNTKTWKKSQTFSDEF